MKKNKLIKWGIVLGAFVILYATFQSKYNHIVRLDEEVIAQWAKVESKYQRRSDLIPNLVAIVKGYAKHESTTLKEVIAARASATQVKIDASNLDAAQLAKFQKSQSSLSSSLGRLLAVAEAYPDLKANQNFLALQSQLEGTENRISVERDRFAESVKNYNTYIRKFPNNLLASMFSFEKRATFSAEEGSDKAPDLEKSFD